MATGTENRTDELTRPRQAAVAAERASEKAEAQRERQGGAAGWVAGRASQWTLDGPDWDFLESQKYFWNPLMDYWFRMEIEGWEHLPPSPALLIGIHAGARSPGMPGPSGCGGGGISAASDPCTGPRMTL